MHDRRLIRNMAASGLSKRGIARQMGISRNTVRRALDLSRPDRYQRASKLDAYEQPVRDLLTRYPLMPTAGVARRTGWDGNMGHFGTLVNRVRKEVRDAGTAR